MRRHNDPLSERHAEFERKARGMEGRWGCYAIIAALLTIGGVLVIIAAIAYAIVWILQNT